MKRYAYLVMALALTIAGCEGPMGPEGPAGPEGEPGEAGPGTHEVFTGQLNSVGDGQVTLPTEAGTASEPPVVSCYVSDNMAGPWIVIATDTYSGAGCGLGYSGGRWHALLYGLPAYWYYKVAVVY